MQNKHLYHPGEIRNQDVYENKAKSKEMKHKNRQKIVLESYVHNLFWMDRIDKT